MTTQPTPPPIARRSDDALGIVRLTRDYALITPLFGGGAEPQQADAATVVRGSEVRAHLRFWWRAVRGGAFGGDLAKMKASEDAIWGAPTNLSASQPSGDAAKPKPPPTVQLALTVTDRGKKFTVEGRRGRNQGREVHIGAPDSLYGYVAFPLYQTDKTSFVLEGVKFTLTLTCAKAHLFEVEAALWGWETFGGIGARTRRGFGALTCTNVSGSRPETPACAQEWIIDQAIKFEARGQWRAGVPHPLYKQVRVAPDEFDRALDAWAYLIEKLRKFRQYRVDKVTGNPNDRGQSVWPEPQEIRSLVQRKVKAKDAPISGKFPRAAFGLPIIFQFKDAKPVKQVELTLSQHDRLASPLILKPLQCASGKSVALAVLLKTPPLPPDDHLELDGHAVSAQISPADAAAIPPLNKNPNVLAAFLAWLMKP